MATENKKRIRSSTLMRVIKLVLPHKGTFLIALLALGLGSGINLLFPELIKRFLDEKNFALLTTHMVEAGFILVALFAIQSLCFYFRSYLFGRVGQLVVSDLRNRLYGNLLRQNVAYFDSSRSADLVSRIANDTLLLQDTVSIKLSVFIRYTFQVVLGVVLMFTLSPILSLLIIVSLPILIGISLPLGKKLKKFSKLQQEELSTASTIADETFSGMKIVKAFDRIGFEHKRFGDAVERTLNAGLRRNDISSFFQSFVSFLLNLCIVLVIMAGVWLVSHGSITFGELTAFLLYGLIVAVSFAFVAGGAAEFVQSLGAAERIFEILDLAPPAPKIANPLPLPPNAAGEIEFKSVNFSYPTRSSVPVLHDFSVKLPAGKITALVGPSGSGKSTIASLILRFYEPDSGEITFDGIDVGHLSDKDYYGSIALVPQDPQLFGVSIGENLRFGKSDATQAELEQACERANVLSFIQSLPEGFDTNVGARGIQLSGGEKQRIAIARAMLRNPRLLILDEATSALDSNNEALVREALAQLMKARTSLVIAHRLSTIKNADQIIVLEQGRIVQQGSHDALSRESGLYRDLVSRQEISTGFLPN